MLWSVTIILRPFGPNKQIRFAFVGLSAFLARSGSPVKPNGRLIPARAARLHYGSTAAPPPCPCICLSPRLNEPALFRQGGRRVIDNRDRRDRPGRELESSRPTPTRLPNAGSPVRAERRRECPGMYTAGLSQKNQTVRARFLLTKRFYKLVATCAELPE